MSEKTPAEETAEREGLPVVLVTNFDLAHILAGYPMIHDTADGGRVLVRLYTPQELVEATERAGAKLREQGLPEGPGMPWHKAVELTTPIKLG